MRNGRRIAALITMITMLSALLAVPSVFAEKYTGSAYDTGLLEVIGVMETADSQQWLSDQTVTRGEAVYYAVKLAGYQDQMNVYEPYYTDVPSENPYAGAITLAQNLKMISPADMFFPDQNVTADQLIRILTAALGYDVFAKLNGGYPVGYLKAANRVDLLIGFSPAGEEAVTFRDMTCLFQNALHSNVMEQVAMGEDSEFRIMDDTTILNQTYDIFERQGQILQNAITSLNAGEGAGEDRVKIGSDVLKVNDAALYAELSRHMGYEVTYYVRDTGESTPELVYFEIGTRNNVTTVFSEDFIGFTDGQIYYEANDRVKTLAVPADASVIYNGKALTEPLAEDIFEDCWGDLRFIRPGNGGKSVLLVTVYENYVASAIDALNYVVYDKTAQERMVDFKEDGSLSPNAYFRSKTGEQLSFDKIAVDNVLSVAMSKDRDYFDVIVVTETVSGVLNTVFEEGKDGRIERVLIDGNSYQVAPNMYGDRVAQLIPGNQYVFGLDAGGRIASIKDGKTVSGGIVFLIDARIVDQGFDDHAEFRLMSSAGKVSTVTGADRIKVDGTRCEDAQQAVKLLTSNPLMPAGPDNPVISQPVQIDLDEDGILTSIDTAYVNDAEDKNNSLQLICAEDTALRYKANPKMFESYFGINSDTKVFFYPSGTADSYEKGADDAYGIAGTSYFSNDSTYIVKAYANEEGSPLASIVTVEGSKASGLASQTYVMTVTDLCETVTQDGNTVVELTGLYAGASTTLQLEDRDPLRVTAETGMKPTDGGAYTWIDVAKGDTIKFGQNNEGYVDEINLLYDFSESKAYVNNDDMEQQKEFQVVCGDLYQQKEGFISLCRDLSLEPNDSANPKRHFNASGFKVYVVEPKLNGEPDIRLGSIEDLREYYTYGNNCSQVVLQMRYFDPRTMVIYQP